MAYVTTNPPTKKALKEAVAAGQRLEVFSPGPFGVTRDGIESVEGPQYPRPHSWYASVEVRDGVIVKVRS